MPVPVWDNNELMMDEPLDTVLSDDIWKKFDLDEPLDISYVHGHHGVSSSSTISAMAMMMSTSSNSGSSSSGSSYEDYNDSGSTNLPEIYDKFSCGDSRKIRHHDCMWAGLCISKEHNRTLPAKKDSQIHSRKVPAGRSLLISSRAASATPQQMCSTSQMHHHQIQQSHSQRRKDNLDSDGDSGRPETPQSSAESETESEEEDDDVIETKAIVKGTVIPPRRVLRTRQAKQEPQDGPLVFRHDQISINEKLSECMSRNAPPKAAPVSEVTGQLVRKLPVNRNKVDDDYQNNGMCSSSSSSIASTSNQSQQQQQGANAVKTEADNWNTLSDHCYHQPSSKKLEHLGVQTPSDSGESQEEEIDVVTFEKPSRPAPSIAEQKRQQSAAQEKPEKTTPAPRPRGRPPSNGTPRKRAAAAAAAASIAAQPDQDPEPEQKPAKRQRTYTRRAKVTKNSPPTPAASPTKSTASSSRSNSSSNNSNSSSDDEPEHDGPDSEKRSLHNNMERQRRIELRDNFENLRLLVPEVAVKDKAAKVTILRQAAVYCDILSEMDKTAEARVNEMKSQQERLRARLSQLRRSLALTR